MPENDAIKQRLDELFASIPFVAPNGDEPDGAHGDQPPASQPLAWSLQHPYSILATLHHQQGSPTSSEAGPSALLLEQSFDRLAAGMFLMDLKGCLVRVNPAFCQMLGYARSELVGAGFQHLVDADDLGLAVAVLRAMLMGMAPPASIELRFLRKDGVPVWLELHPALLPGASRKPAFISLLAWDISTRPRPEAGLQPLIPEREPRLSNEFPHPEPEPSPPSGEFEWLPDPLFDLSPGPATLPDQPDLAPPVLAPPVLAPPVLAPRFTPDASEWQLEASPDFPVADSSSELRPGASPGSSGQTGALGDDEFPPVVYLPAQGASAAKTIAPNPRRPRTYADLPGATADLAAAPLAALILPRQMGASILASPWQRLAEGLGRIPFTVYLLLYLLGIALAEMVTTFASPQLGLVIHSGLLILIFLHASIGADRAEQIFLYTLALAPLIRLMSLSMPLLEFQFLYWYMVIGAPLFLSVWLVFRLTGYTQQQVGLSWGSGLPLQLGVAATGLVLGYLEHLILKPNPLVESFSLQSIWLPALILLIFTGFLEELIFRGLMQRASLTAIGKLGPVYVSLLFAVLHIGYRSLADFFFVLLVGLFFSWVVARTRSLLGVTLAHGLTNISLFLIFPFWPF